MSWGVCHVPFLSTFCWDPGQNLKFSTEDYKYNKMIQLLFTFILKCVAGWSLNTHSICVFVDYICSPGYVALCCVWEPVAFAHGLGVWLTTDLFLLLCFPSGSLSCRDKRGSSCLSTVSCVSLPSAWLCRLPSVCFHRCRRYFMPNSFSLKEHAVGDIIIWSPAKIVSLLTKKWTG